MKIRTYAAMTLITLSTLAASQNSASGALLIDNFESYTNGQPLGTSATSTPYLRFGGAVADNFSATTSAARVINGSVSGQIPFNWTSATNASVRRNYTTATPQDFSAYDQVTVSIKSTNLSTTAVVRLSFADGDTSWQSTTALPITGTAQTLTFGLTAAAMTRGGGTSSFADSVNSVSAIGFRIENTVGAAGDTIIFDDITLNSTAPAVPEPATLGLLGIASAGLLARRRKA
jgi:hypothetical protein